MDVLAEFLKTIKLDGALFFTGEFSAPWSIRCVDSKELAPFVSSRKGHVITFHLLTEGKAFVRLTDGPKYELTVGDIVVLPHGDQHYFSAGFPERPVEAMKVFAGSLARSTNVVRFGGGGEVTRFVCGFVCCAPRLSEILLAVLPRILLVRKVGGPEWLGESLQHLVRTGGSGDDSSEMIRTKLAEALFLETIRRFVSGLPLESTGWLAGTRDPYVGRALALIHKNPQAPWTLESLGSGVGLSRSRLVERFQRYLGTSPMAYLGSWRLNLAADLLHSGMVNIAEVASRVGYGSDAGFSRAFKREFGLPPAQFRILAACSRAG